LLACGLKGAVAGAAVETQQWLSRRSREMAITRVWIEEGCTMCGLCSDNCPDVFKLDEDAETAKVVEGADLAANEDTIKESAEDCPEEVIKFEEA